MTEAAAIASLLNFDIAIAGLQITQHGHDVRGSVVFARLLHNEFLVDSVNARSLIRRKPSSHDCTPSAHVGPIELIAEERVFGSS